MAEDGEVGVVHRGEDALGHLRLIETEAGVNRADDEVEAVERRRVVVEPAVGEDVRLDAFEHADAGDVRVHPVDLRVLAHDGVRSQAHREWRRLAVVAEADPLVARAFGGFGPLGDRHRAVGVVRVAVREPLHVPGLNEARQLALRGGLAFSLALAQLGRDPREPDGFVDAFLVGEASGRIELAREQLVPVRGGAGRVHPGEAEVSGRREHDVDTRSVAEPAHQLVARFVTDILDDEIEIADDLTPPPQAARDLDAPYAGERGQRLLHPDRLGAGVVEQPEFGGPLEERDAFENVRRRLGAEARHLREPAVPRGHLQLGECRDVQLLVDLPHLLDAEPGDLEHLHQARRYFVAQLVEHGRAPAAQQLANDLQRRLAHAVQLRERTTLQRLGEIARVGRDGAGGVLERADAERVVALQGERGGDLLEDGADSWLIHERGTLGARQKPVQRRHERHGRLDVRAVPDGKLDQLRAENRGYLARARNGDRIERPVNDQGRWKREAGGDLSELRADVVLTETCPDEILRARGDAER